MLERAIMTRLLKRFLHDESGAALDTAVLVTGISLVIIPTVNEIGAKLEVIFETLNKALR
jgi:Flp pilus assembly pilin Flp